MIGTLKLKVLKPFCLLFRYGLVLRFKGYVFFRNMIFDAEETHAVLLFSELNLQLGLLRQLFK